MPATFTVVLLSGRKSKAWRQFGFEVDEMPEKWITNKLYVTFVWAVFLTVAI